MRSRRGEQPTQSPRVRWCSTYATAPVVVVDLDVRRPVPVGLRRRQSVLGRVVGEHPPGRVGDREREAPAGGAPARSRRPRSMSRRTGARRRTEHHVEAAVGERQLRSPCRAPRAPDAGLLVDAARVLELSVGQVEPVARPPCVDPARALAGAGAHLEHVAAGDVAEDAASVLGQPLGPTRSPVSPRNSPCVAWYSSAYRSQSGPLARRDSARRPARRLAPDDAVDA